MALQLCDFLQLHFEYGNLFIAISLPSYTNIPLIKEGFLQVHRRKKSQLKKNCLLNQKSVLNYLEGTSSSELDPVGGNLIMLSEEVTFSVAMSCAEQTTFWTSLFNVVYAAT